MRTNRFLTIARLMVCLIALSLLAGSVNKVYAAAAAADKKSKSRVITLQTDDGVILKGTYYPSEAGKKAVPVVLLHDHMGTRVEFKKLAAALLKTGGEQTPFAVLAIDLRAHGDSTKQIIRNGHQRDLNAGKLTKKEMLSIQAYDMKAVRKFLVDENDAEHLNLNKLCVVGVGMGATVAMNWTAEDWSYPELPGAKQGQDVKAVVLISPRLKFKGVSVLNAMKQPSLQNGVSFAIVYGGKDIKFKKDANRIYNDLNKWRSKPGPGEKAKPATLVVSEIDSALQGNELLTEIQGTMAPKFAHFFSRQLKEKDSPWSKRRSK